MERTNSDDERMRLSLEQSTRALALLAEVLVKPGIRLPRLPGVPLFRVDEDDPDVPVRLLDGVEERGRWMDGGFQPTPGTARRVADD